MATQDETGMLIIIVKSNSANAYCKYGFSVADMREFTKDSNAKEELVSTLRKLANNIEVDYPGVK